ncbi:hypothetical protein [Terribacillus sp. JSM ZJ617]|uniref:hypothetical protein n=1 Tax=Terribacillus sp. JSM ZJ617 TaxID=3342119 RepID=UPI0035A8682C
MTFDVEKAVEAQKKLCDEKGLPHFAPRFGTCYNCRTNIYEEKQKTRKDFLSGENVSYMTGITVEKAASELITGCPHCNRTYCD